MYSRLGNAVFIFNETFVLLLVSLMFLFTDYVPDPVLRYDFGYKFLYICGLVVAANLLVFVYNIASAIYNGCKHFFVKRQGKKRVYELNLRKALDQKESGISS